MGAVQKSTYTRIHTTSETSRYKLHRKNGQHETEKILK